MAKANTMKAPDPNSKRSKRRANRPGGAGLSRPQRRAASRLKVATALFNKAGGTTAGYTEPGAQKMW